MGGKALNELHAVHARHQQVGEHQIEVALFQAIQCFFAVLGARQIEVAQLAEQVLQIQVLEGVIFDNQNATGLHGRLVRREPGQRTRLVA
ncbi:hypothetical protein D3C72_536900 [compost metagenome]